MMQPLQAGDPQLAGQFRLRARLGAGGMGRVFLGYSPAGRAVAVKVCHPEFAADPAFVQRFAMEVAAARSVNGLFTAQVIDAGPDDSPPWLATSYVPGPSLYGAVLSDGPLPEPAVWRLAAGLAEALAAVHVRGLVHRDLKPTNVLLAADGPRVIDFGIARALDGAALTTTGTTFGTPSYMSPEQAQGRPAGPQSDVFALGGVLCFAATGAVPFGEDDPAAVLYRVVQAPPVLDGIPESLHGLVAACLAKDPAARPGLRQLLAACQAGAQAPGDPDHGAASFWPGQVAALIARHRAGLDGMASTLEPAGDPTLGAGGGIGPLVRPAPSRPGQPGPAPGPVVGRRRALAGLASLSVAGLAAGGWALSRSGGRQPVPSQGPGTPRWVRPTSGQVTSGAAISGGVLYLGGADGVYAFEAGSGRPAGVHRADGTVPGAVTVAGGTLFAGDGHGTVHAVAVAAGGVSWTRTLRGPVGTRPAVANGRVYVGSDDHQVHALDAGTGQPLWAYPTGGPVRSSPRPSAVSFNDYVYAGSDDGHLYALHMKTGGLGWRYRAGGAVAAGPLVIGGTVYAGDDGGHVSEVDGPPADGIWRFPARGAVGAIEGTPVAYGQTLFLGSADSSVYAVDLNSGIQIWKYPVGGPVRSGPAISWPVLYAGSDDGYLYAIDVTTQTLRWRYRTGGPVRSQILVAGGLVYFGSLDHHVYALRG
jgi:outer membrane protein assembly factor BamB